MSLRALILEKQDGGPLVHIVGLDDAALSVPEALANEVTVGDTLIRVDWSTINYKNGLAVTDKDPVVRKWPMVADIDGAGVVLDSSYPDWRMGDAVVLNNRGVDETHWGCLAQQARFSGDWLMTLPVGLDVRQTIMIDVAGHAAMLSALTLERVDVKPGDGEVLVTDISSGVGSVATVPLGKLGYRVVVSIGKMNEVDFLQALSAREMINHAELSTPGKPLQKEHWTTMVDSVGSHTLVNARTRVRYGGVVTACGLAQGMNFPATVAPFVLHGMTLCGIDSVMTSRALRKTAWQRPAANLLLGRLAAITRGVTLSRAIDATHDIMAGKMHGRVVVDANRQVGKPAYGRFAPGNMG